MKNTGILLENRQVGDNVYGGFSTTPVARAVLDWSSYLPDGEVQKDALTDFMNCTTFSGVHGLETQINYDIEQGKYRQEALDYFQSAGYMENGKFRISVRYSATMNGTTTDGQYMSKVGLGFKNGGDGLLPNKDLPMLPTMSWTEYYAPVSADLIAKAKKIYDYIDFDNHWVDPYNIASALLNAPVQVAIAVCDGWNTSPLIGMCGGACAHCVLVYGEDTFGDYLILDHYNPFLKKLASNYHIFAAMQYVATPKLPPNLWSKLLSVLKSFK